MSGFLQTSCQGGGNWTDPNGMKASTLQPSTFVDVGNKTRDFSQPYPDFHSEVPRTTAEPNYLVP